MRDIDSVGDEEAGKDKGNHEEASSKTEERRNEVKHESDHAKQDEKKKDEAPTEDFVIEKIVDYKINRSWWNRYAKVGNPLYKARWYDYHEDDDTWESKKHLLRSKILSYYREKKLRIPHNIEQADEG